MVRDAHAYTIGLKAVKNHPLIERLAQTWPNLQNAEKKLESLIPWSDAVDPHHVPDSSIEWVIKPYDMFHWLRRSHPRKFRIHLGATNEGVQDWWEGLLASPSGEEFWNLHP